MRRYRLMLRRCIESANPRFGMILPARGGATEYGTMLEIRSIQTLNDGRSMVETVGSWRFKVLEKGGLDGYTVGRVERCVTVLSCVLEYLSWVLVLTAMPNFLLLLRIDDISSEDEAEREAAAIARGRESRRNSTASSSGLGSTASTADYSNAPSTSSGGSRLPSSSMSSFPASFGDTISDGSIPPQHSSIPTSAPMLRPLQVAASSSTADVSSSTSIPSSIATETESAPSFDMVASSLVQPKRNPADLSTQALMDICEAFIDHLRSGSAPWLLQRLNNTYGPMPDDPTTCSYWMASVSPVYLAIPFSDDLMADD